MVTLTKALSKPVSLASVMAAYAPKPAATPSLKGVCPSCGSTDQLYAGYEYYQLQSKVNAAGQKTFYRVYLTGEICGLCRVENAGRTYTASA